MNERAKKDYSSAHVLLPFLAEFVQKKSRYNVLGVELVRDGSMRWRLEHQSKPMTFLWSEGSRSSPVELGFSGGVVAAERTRKTAKGQEKIRLERAAKHLAGRLSRLLDGKPPNLLQWRNRNSQSIIWGKRMFNNLCPGMLVRGETRYFDYTVSDIDEYEGYLNVRFQSRRASVLMRLLLSDGGEVPANALISWGPIALVILQDERTKAQRRRAEHQVEEFLGYLLSRNLPPEFSLVFDCDDPPAGYQRRDQGVDFIRTKRLDDSSFFEMMFDTDGNIGVVSSCDRECFNLFSLVYSAKESWTTIAPWQMLPSEGYLSHCYNVSLTSKDAVMGDERTERCLEQIAQSPAPPDLIIFFDSCMHRIIGEDVQGKLSAYRQKHSVPLVYYDIRTTQHPYLQQLRDFWKNLYRQVARPDLAPDPDRVGFLGLGQEMDRLLETALSGLGIRVGGLVFPRLPLETIKDINRNSLMVANCWEFVRIMFSDMQAEMERPFIRLPLPYGVEGTNIWLDAVHRGLRSEPADLDGIAEISKAREEFMEERSRIQGRRVGLVARLRGVKNRLSPNLRFGVPLIGLLHELGLGIDLNLFVQPDEEAPADSEVSGWLGLDSQMGDSISCFHDPDQLMGVLERGDFELVYTEKYHDRRVTAAGKSPLELRQLSPGYSGAVDTARMVRGVLQAAFHRRYHAFFKGAEQ